MLDLIYVPNFAQHVFDGEKKKIWQVVGQLIITDLLVSVAGTQHELNGVYSSLFNKLIKIHTIDIVKQ